MDDAPAYSRPRNSDPSGKCDDRLDVPMSAELRERLAALAVLNGQSTAEYVRSLLARHVYGELHMLQMMTRRGAGTNGSNIG